MSSRLSGRVLILDENAPVPFDRRVWQQARSLADAGLDVVVAAPRADGEPSIEMLDGVEIHRFDLEPASSIHAYAREYAAALVKMSLLVRKLTRRGRFDVIQACNPPDLLLLTAWPQKRRGTKLVFDHHDLVPELYLSRFGRERDVLYRATLQVEKLSFRLADLTLATNESYKEIAVRRGGKDPKDVFVVRNAPDLERFRPTRPDPALKGGREYLLAYVGIMAPQDGVDHAVRALAELKQRRSDWRAVFAGGGDAVGDLRGLAVDLGLTEDVEFTGMVGDDLILPLLATADVALAPEPSSPLNDLSTMIKVAEYMAMSCPVVAFDLPETRVTAAGAALYATANDESAFAQRIDELLTDESLRKQLGAAGRQRVEADLSWKTSERALFEAYERALSRPRAA
jgi:glycosyltransferase involved in cell wall biosynthesis